MTEFNKTVEANEVSEAAAETETEDMDSDLEAAQITGVVWYE